MGEQRSRRPGKQPAIDLIDTARSRGLSAAPQARKTRPERHRKSDRRREHKASRKRSSSNRDLTANASSSSSPERPANPRVNPIFVWVRQQDTHIVEVKCEDYDKRNRILLTKTAQGWRAIPRTETLVPSLKEVADEKIRHRKSRKNHRTKRKSTGIQVDGPPEIEEPKSPTWTSPVNIESHLPSHTIHVTRKRSLSPEDSVVPDVPCVNSDVNSSAQEPSPECSASKMYDVSPLDNLLAVAELEFNHQLQTGEWKETDERPQSVDSNKSDNKEEDKEFIENKEYIENMEQLNDFIENYSECNTDQPETMDDYGDLNKSDECDYNDDDGDNLAMDDILNRLEQSLRSPDAISTDLTNIVAEVCEIEEDKIALKEPDVFVEATDEDDDLIEIEPPKIESSVKLQELPTDLSITKKQPNEIETDQPTDLSLPKNKILSPPRPAVSPRPPSHSSETIQSPQPSGIPAVPPSPDTFNNNTIKSKSGYLETLLTTTTTTTNKNVTEPEITTSHKEPLDLVGKCRESASPTVTCSEEIRLPNGPLTKKQKVEDITLKKLLVHEKEKPTSEIDPVTQLKQVLANPNYNVPDPMLVPKDRLSHILSSPGKDIPKLLKERPELRLPEALSFPHLLQDPDILVITLAQLETIIQKQSQPLPLNEIHNKSKELGETMKPAQNVKTRTALEKEKPSEEKEKIGKMNGLANDIDAATNAAFNQMMWLPYLNQLELATLGLGSNPELFKMLSSMLPTYPGQLAEMNALFNRYPPTPTPNIISPTPYTNPMEISMWHEAMAQASLMKNKNPYEFHNKNTYRDYMDKLNANNNSGGGGGGNKKSNQKTTNKSNFYPSSNIPPSQMHNTYVNSHYQQNNMRHNLQIPQYNPVLQKNLMELNKMGASSHSKTKNCHHLQATHHNIPPHQNVHQNNHNAYTNNQLIQQQLNKKIDLATNNNNSGSKQKVTCKPLSNLTYSETSRKNPESTKHPSGTNVQQPIDLSGSTTPNARLKVKQHLIDPHGSNKFLKHDDIPEVGSTTGSIEEMQDSQKHLWHPLFGR